MKLISENQVNKVYRNGTTVIKTGPRDAILWEASILEKLEGTHGIPRLLDVDRSLGDSGANTTMIMDYMPGKHLIEAIKNNADSCRTIITHTIHFMVADIYSKGVVHLRINPENILMTEDDTISIIGFGKSKILKNPQMTKFVQSPDVIGLLKPELFDLEGPHPANINGCYMKILDFLFKEATQCVS